MHDPQEYIVMCDDVLNNGDDDDGARKVISELVRFEKKSDHPSPSRKQREILNLKQIHPCHIFIFHPIPTLFSSTVIP